MNRFMAEMTQEEMVQEVLDRVLQSSTGVEDLETVTSLNGVKSLPGEKDGKMVIVPLELIGKPASDAAARAAHGVGGAEHDGVAQLGGHLLRFLHGIDGFGLGHRHADLVHGFLENDTVFTAGDGFQVHADDFHVVLLQDAFLIQLGGQVQGRLAAEVGQQSIRAFLFNHGRDAVHGQGLNVGVVRHAGVRHDGGGVGVHQNDVVAFSAQGLAGLGAGVVEFAALADDDRAGADHENLFDGGIFRHNGDGRILWFWTVDFRRGN